MRKREREPNENNEQHLLIISVALITHYKLSKAVKLIACSTALKVLNIFSLWDNLLETSFELWIQSRKDGALSLAVSFFILMRKKCHIEQCEFEIL